MGWLFKTPNWLGPEINSGRHTKTCLAELVSAGVKWGEYIISCHAELVSASYRLVITRQIGKVLN